MLISIRIIHVQENEENISFAYYIKTVTRTGMLTALFLLTHWDFQQAGKNISFEFNSLINTYTIVLIKSSWFSVQIWY